MENFIYTCKYCGQKYECDESWIGARIKCQSCGKESVVRMPKKESKTKARLIFIVILVVFCDLLAYVILSNYQNTETNFPYHKLGDKINLDYARFYHLWKNKDSKNNQAETLFLIGKYIHESKGFSGNYPDALEYYKKAAELGNIKAYHNMGCIHSHPIG